ncbi:MAG: peptide transporter [Sulfurimonas sp.]|nr:peptide transporter [Sulfurimonas sp.]
MNNLTSETKLTILYIFIAFAFSVAMRMIWVYQFNGYEPFMFNGQFMINTNDGYFWAEGARDILSGVSQENDRSPITLAASQLTAIFAYILPFSFESIILYMSVFLSSLIVIPIILIAKNFKNLEMGLIAALLASITVSYYNRTMVGYYDTDMLNIVFPMFFLWSIIWGINTNQNRYLIIVAIDILLYRWWYPQSYALEFSFFSLILLYTIIFDRKNLYNYKLLAIIMIAMINLDGLIRVALVLGVFYLFTQEKFQKYVFYIFGASIVAFFITGGFTPIWAHLKGYLFAKDVIVNNEGLGLHFYSVMQTVREAGEIPFEVFANRISGHSITFILSLVGYVWLAYKHRVMLFALPMIGLGFLAWYGGLRFTIYAVPILAMGIAFLITELTSKITDKKSIKYFSYFMLTLAILYPNYKHIDNYKTPTVFNVDEVKILDKLKNIADREDYVIAWWDYGYPIRYYSDVKTLSDGGKHSGSVNFVPSFILTNTQQQAAKMARLDVEYTENIFKIIKENAELEKPKKLNIFSNIEEMTKDYGFYDTNDFLLSLETDIELPKKTRDIYFYLPFKMLNIYPTVKMFSNIDLMYGNIYERPFFFMSRNYETKDNITDLGRGVSLDLNKKIVQIGSNIIPIRRFVRTAYNDKMELQVKQELMNFSSNYSVIFMKNYNTILVLDEDTFNSLYIQLMVLERYDEDLFERVLMNPHAKIYKLKI